MLASSLSYRSILICLLISLLVSINKNVLPVLMAGLVVLNFEKLSSFEGRLNIVCGIVSFETLARVIKMAPIIPYELGKYALILFLTIELLIRKKIHPRGFFMILLLMPGIIYGLSDGISMQSILFNVGGVFSISLFFLIFSNSELTLQSLKEITTAVFYPLVILLFYVIITSPRLSNISFGLNANFAATAGFGTNQISTIFGLGTFLSVVLLRLEKRTYMRFLLLFLASLFLIRALASFSRGGVIVSALSIFHFSFINETTKFNFSSFRSKSSLVIIFGILISVLVYVNRISGEALLLRYQGETTGTLAGVKEKDLNTLTSNRFNILGADWKLLKANPIFGVGCGKSSFERQQYLNGKRELAHIEFFRILSEHGVLGIAWLSLFTISTLKIKKNNKSLLISFFVLGIVTTFHSAMRTFITPLLILLFILIDEK